MISETVALFKEEANALVSKLTSGRVWLHTHSNCSIFVYNIDFSFSFKEYSSSLNTVKLVFEMLPI